MDEIIVRPMLLAELPDVLKEFHDNWIDSENTLTATFNYDNEGFLIAVNSTGAIVGVIAGCRISDDVGFIGFLVVKKEVRGKGVGRILLNRSLEHLGDRNIGLDALTNVLDMYPKRGFKTLSFSGVICRGKFDKNGLIFSDLDKAFEATGATVQLYTDDYNMKLIDYDTTIHTIERVRFMKQWMSPTVTTTYVALRNNDIIGYGCVQVLEPGAYYMGPVYSDDKNVAKMIIYNLAKHVPDGSSLALEFVTTNDVSKKIVEAIGLVPSSHYTRLYNKEEIKIPEDKVFMLATGAMGLI